MFPKTPGTIEAANLLKDWSVTVIAVDSGVLTALGVALLTGSVTDDRGLVTWSIALLVVSLFSTLWVLGALPGVAEKLASEGDPKPSIYLHRNLLGMPLWLFAFVGHFSLIAAVVLLGLFLARTAA